MLNLDELKEVFVGFVQQEMRRKNVQQWMEREEEWGEGGGEGGIGHFLSPFKTQSSLEGRFRMKRFQAHIWCRQAMLLDKIIRVLFFSCFLFGYEWNIFFQCFEWTFSPTNWHAFEHAMRTLFLSFEAYTNLLPDLIFPTKSIYLFNLVFTLWRSAFVIAISETSWSCHRFPS